MIAKNYRKFPEAMALQLVLIFGACVWHTSRPTTRAGRAIRAARGQLVKHTPQLVNWVKVATPQWWKNAKQRASFLSKQVKSAIFTLAFDLSEEKTDAIQLTDWLIADFLDEHHGNQARPLKWAIRNEDHTWVHVPSNWIFTKLAHHGYRG